MKIIKNKIVEAKMDSRTEQELTSIADSLVQLFYKAASTEELDKSAIENIAYTFAFRFANIISNNPIFINKTVKMDKDDKRKRVSLFVNALIDGLK